MFGEKMEKAKQAAIRAVDRLGEDDIVSVIAYNHGVSVLVPATKATNRGNIQVRHSEIARDRYDGALRPGVRPNPPSCLCRIVMRELLGRTRSNQSRGHRLGATLRETPR